MHYKTCSCVSEVSPLITPGQLPLTTHMCQLQKHQPSKDPQHQVSNSITTRSTTKNYLNPKLIPQLLNSLSVNACDVMLKHYCLMHRSVTFDFEFVLGIKPSDVTF